MKKATPVFMLDEIDKLLDDSIRQGGSRSLLGTCEIANDIIRFLGDENKDPTQQSYWQDVALMCMAGMCTLYQDTEDARKVLSSFIAGGNLWGLDSCYSSLTLSLVARRSVRFGLVDKDTCHATKIDNLMVSLRAFGWRSPPATPIEDLSFHVADPYTRSLVVAVSGLAAWCPFTVFDSDVSHAKADLASLNDRRITALQEGGVLYKYTLAGLA